MKNQYKLSRFNGREQLLCRLGKNKNVIESYPHIKLCPNFQEKISKKLGFSVILPTATNFKDFVKF